MYVVVKPHNSLGVLGACKGVAMQMLDVSRVSRAFHKGKDI